MHDKICLAWVRDDSDNYNVKTVSYASPETDAFAASMADKYPHIIFFWVQKVYTTDIDWG